MNEDQALYARDGEPALPGEFAENSAGILIASHPRSGTHLLIDVIRRQFPTTRSWRWWGLPLDYLYFNIERSTSDNRYFNAALRKKVMSRPTRPLLKTHYLADWSSTWVEEETGSVPDDVADIISRSSTLYIHRDPRDVMVSYKQFLSSIRPEVADLGLVEFMKARHWSGDDMIGWWQRHVEGWLATSGTVSLSYRDLIKSSKAMVERIGNMIDETPDWQDPILPEKVSTVARTRRDRLLSLSPASTGIVADRNRFPMRPWKEEMTEADHVWLESRIGPVMDLLGYKRMATSEVTVGE